jgi:CheY-like chemotaxis protein
MSLLVAYMDDLLFLSRIRESVRPMEVKAVRRVPDLLALSPSILVLDIDSPRLDSLEALRAIREDPGLSHVPVLAFYSHVHPERKRDAEAAGCTAVFPRSTFLVELQRALPRNA